MCIRKGVTKYYNRAINTVKYIEIDHIGFLSAASQKIIGLENYRLGNCTLHVQTSTQSDKKMWRLIGGPLAAGAPSHGTTGTMDNSALSYIADAVGTVLLSASEEKEDNQEIVIVIDEVKTEDADAATEAAPSDEQSQQSTSLLQLESQQLSAATGEICTCSVSRKFLDCDEIKTLDEVNFR